MSKPFITGLYGCNCHPFESWAECDKAHRQKLSVGDIVSDRCTGKFGPVDEVLEEHFYIVKLGTDGVERDYELCHAAELVKK
jgi:hypothetical protein